MIEAGEGFQTRPPLEALIGAQPGNIIELPEGEFALDSGISLDVDNVTIRARATTRGILNFGSPQASGGESVLVTSK